MCALAFVKLLMEATAYKGVSVFVVLTMRADFLDLSSFILT